jgi:type I restriction enzyme S subunit
MKMKLKDMASLVNGYAFKSEKYVDNGIRVIRIANVQDGYLSDESPCYYPNECRDVIKNANLCENDLLMSLTGNVGRVAFVTRDFLPAGLNQRVECIRPNESDDKEYLYYYFRSQVFREKVNSATTGCAQQNLSIKWLENHEIPYYDKDECRNIVEDLKHFDCVISNKKEQLKSLDELVKSRFIEMFGDPEINEKGFASTYLNKLGTLARGKSKHRPRNDPKLLGGPYPLIQTGDIASASTYLTKFASTYSELGLKQSKMWPKGTLCITIAANIAETAILGFDACFPDSVVGFVPNDGINIIFIKYQLEMLKEALNRKATSVAQKNLNLEKLSATAFINPSSELQNQFAEFVKQVDKSKFIVQKQIKELQELLDSKMDEYFG